MPVVLNGKETPLDEAKPLQDLLTQWHYEGCFAVAINGSFVPQGQYTTHTVRPGDVVDVVAPMQGG